MDGIIGLFQFIFFIAIVLVIYVVVQYNQIQTLWQGVLASRQNIDASLKKRAALVSKLEDIAIDYAKRETSTHVAVAQETSGKAHGVEFVTRLAGQFPELKASGTYQQLMFQLTDLETDLQNKFEAYGRVAQGYNTRICQVPTNLYISKLGFKPAPYLDAQDENTLDSRVFTSNDGTEVRTLLSKGVSNVIGAENVTSESEDENQAAPV